LKGVVLPATGEFERQAIRRAITVTLPGAGASIAVAAVEDILLAKLRWFRIGGEVSAVQQRDIERLVTLNRDQLDLTHLTQWAAVLGVSDLLERAIAG
jgi:anti-sigma factor ChrR (cupin superfamily)